MRWFRSSRRSSEFIVPPRSAQAVVDPLALYGSTPEHDKPRTGGGIKLKGSSRSLRDVRAGLKRVSIIADDAKRFVCNYFLGLLVLPFSFV